VEVIRCCELLLSIDFLGDYDFELNIMSDGKVVFKITDGYVVFLAVVCHLFSIM
jgi:hypothetical protein